VAVVEAGEVRHLNSYGFANLATGTRFRIDHVMPIASVTKHFTTFCVLSLEAAGRLSLEDVVQERFPGMISVAAPITVRQLCNNTSGLRDYITLASLAGGRLMMGLDKGIISDLIKRQYGLNFEPGSAFCYSNTNFVVLSWIIEQVTGKPLGAVFDELIFTPLGMTRSRLVEDPNSKPEHTVNGYVGSRRGGFSPWHWDSHGAGDGGVWSSLEDMAKWEAFVQTDIKASRIFSRMREVPVLPGGQSSNYGFGLYVGAEFGLDWEGHSGGYDGYRSYRLHFPGHNLGVTVMANQTIDPGAAAFEVARCFLEEQHVLDQYAGEYFCGELNCRYQIEAIQGQLLISCAGPFELLMRLPLTRVGDHRFRLARAALLQWDLEFPTTFEFVLDQKGRACDLTVDCEWARQNRFERVR